MYNMRQAKDWERFRFMAWYSTLPYRSKGDSSSPYDIMKLETDPGEDDMKSYRQREHEDALLFSLDGLVALSDVSLALGDEARELGQLLALIGELGHQLMSKVAQL